MIKQEQQTSSPIWWQTNSLRLSGSTQVAVLLFVLSLSVRLVFLIPFAVLDIPLLFDEGGYYTRAIGFNNIFQDVLSLDLPAREDVGRAYGGGSWPPVHPLFLATGIFLLGENTLYARLVTVLLSALTTPLVYFLTLKLSTKKVAVAAAVIHMVYPSFVAYSHYLWSESSYIFLLILAVYCTVSIPEAPTPRRKILYAALTGLFLGLGVLTRAAALLYLVVVPAWLAFSIKENRNRLLLAGTVVVVGGLTLLPWQFALTMLEKRFVPISTTGGHNLYLGNNPWTPDGLGSSWGDTDSKNKMKAAIAEYVELHAVDKEVAARALAGQYIQQDYAGLLTRAFYKLRMLWTIDTFTLRHIFHVIYPPMPGAVVGLLWVGIAGSYILLLGLSVWGLTSAGTGLSYKGLILTLVVVGMIPPLITISMPRLNLPLLALLLPAAGYGIVHLRQKPRLKPVAATALTMVIVGLFVLTSLPFVVSLYLKPSSYYAQVIRPTEAISTADVLFNDQIVLKADETDVPEGLDVTISSMGYRFETNDSQTYRWEAPAKNRELVLDIVGQNPTMPLEIKLSSRGSNRAVVFRPTTRQSWRQWQASDLDGVEYMWSGGGRHRTEF